VTEVEFSGFKQFAFNFGLFPGGKETSLPFASRRKRSRNVDNPLQGPVAETGKPPWAQSRILSLTL
jgi:hypothetical protein